MTESSHSLTGAKSILIVRARRQHLFVIEKMITTLIYILFSASSASTAHFSVHCSVLFSLKTIVTQNYKNVAALQYFFIPICADALRQNGINMNVVFFTFPHHGHINPQIGLIKELVQRGEVVHCISSDYFKNVIVNAGAKFYSYGDCKLFESGIKKANENDIEETIIIRINYHYRLRVIRKEVAARFTSYVKNISPDYILYDFSASWGKQIAVDLNIKCVCCIPAFVYPKHPFHVDFNFFLKYILEIKDSQISNLDQKQTKKLVQRQLKYLSLKHNEDVFNIFDDYYSDNLNIIYLAKEFNPYSEFIDDKSIFVGYSLPNCPKEDTSFPYEYPTKHPIIFITQGSIESNEDKCNIKKYIQAFGNTEFNILITVGINSRVPFIEQLPSNIIITNGVDQLNALRHSSLFITHGGCSGVREAICSHVPILITHLNATEEKVKELGVGLVALVDDAKAEDILNLSKIIINDRNYAYNCQVLGETFKAAGGYSYAVDSVFCMIGKIN